MTYEHSFAKVWLDKLGNKILVNDHDFLSEDIDEVKDKFRITPLNTSIISELNLLEKEELSEVIEISYADMKKLGLAIYSIPADDKAWRSNQRNIFYIGRKRSGLISIPEGTMRCKKSKGEYRIVQDRLNKCIKIEGIDFGTTDGIYLTGAETPWIYYELPREKKIDTGRFGSIEEVYSKDELSESVDMWVKTTQGKEDEIRHMIKIKEVPFIITTDGGLLCFPKFEEGDPLPMVLIVGKRGKGKTLSMNSLLGRVVYILKHRAGVLNDSLNQLYDLMLPADNKDFIKQLNIVGNEPKYLPVILLYMSCPNLQIKYNDEQIGYRLVVSVKSFIRDWKGWTDGVKKWDLGKPERYLVDFIDDIKDVKNSGELREMMMDKIPNAHKDKSIQSMIYKWEKTFESVFEDEFTSNLFYKEKSTASYWKVRLNNGEELYGHPFLIAMEAGLVPVINNYMAKDYPIAKKQMTNLLHNIVLWQMQRGKDKQKKIWIFIDELKDFLGKKRDKLYEELDYLFTQSRFNNIGFVGNIQEYTKLSDSMRANSTHLVIFELQTDVERKAVAKDYKIEEEKIDDVAKLKTFQCLFVTKEKMVIYKDGKREVVDGGVWKGRVLPPISRHIAP